MGLRFTRGDESLYRPQHDTVIFSHLLLPTLCGKMSHPAFYSRLSPRERQPAQSSAGAGRVRGSCRKIRRLCPFDLERGSSIDGCGLLYCRRRTAD